MRRSSEPLPSSATAAANISGAVTFSATACAIDSGDCVASGPIGSTMPALLISSTLRAPSAKRSSAPPASQAATAAGSDRSSASSAKRSAPNCVASEGCARREMPSTATSRCSSCAASAAPRPRVWPVTMARIGCEKETVMIEIPVGVVMESLPRASLRGGAGRPLS